MKVQSKQPRDRLKSVRDYSAVGRKAFLVEDLEDGALPLYDKDPIVPAYAVGEVGDSIQVLVSSERVMAPLYELATWPMIPLTQIRERRYDLIKRTIELGVAGVKEKEDVRVFATMNALADDPDNPHQDIMVSPPLTADAIADAIGAIEEHGLRAARIFINGRDYADIRKFDKDVIDQETMQALFRTGYVGKISWLSGYPLTCYRPWYHLRLRRERILRQVPCSYRIDGHHGRQPG